MWDATLNFTIYKLGSGAEWGGDQCQMFNCFYNTLKLPPFVYIYRASTTGATMVFLNPLSEYSPSHEMPTVAFYYRLLPSCI